MSTKICTRNFIAPELEESKTRNNLDIQQVNKQLCIFVNGIILSNGKEGITDSHNPVIESPKH